MNRAARCRMGRGDSLAVLIELDGAVRNGDIVFVRNIPNQHGKGDLPGVESSNADGII